MEKLRDAFRELTSGPPRRRVRIWEALPELLREEERSARTRNRSQVRQAASHLAIGEACLESLASGVLSELVTGSEVGQRRFIEARKSIVALMVRYATPPLPDPLLRELALALGDDNDPFRHVRRWTESFAPGREVVPETEIEPGPSPVFFQAGLIRRGPAGVQIRRSLLTFLWCSRLRRALQAENRSGSLAFVRCVAGARPWGRVVVLVAGHLHGTALTSFLASVHNADTRYDLVGSGDGRLALAARCLGNVPAGRLPSNDSTAPAIADEVATQVLARLEQAAGSPMNRLPKPNSLEKALAGCAKWCRGSDLRVGPERLTRERWIEQLHRNIQSESPATAFHGGDPKARRRIAPDQRSQQHELALVRRVPELFATPGVLTWLSGEIRNLPPVPEPREETTERMSEFQAEEKRDHDLLNQIRAFVQASQPSTTQEPLLRVIAEGLVNPNGGIAGRMATVASFLAPTEANRSALEPLLLALANSITHTQTQKNLALDAARRLGSIHPVVLDHVHTPTQWLGGSRPHHGSLFGEDEMYHYPDGTEHSGSDPEAGQRLRKAMENRLLDRLQDLQPPQDLIATLKGFSFSSSSSNVAPRVVRRIARLIRDPRPDVTTAAVDVLVPLASSSNQTVAQEATRQITRLLTGRVGSLRLAVLRAILADRYSNPPLTPATLARLICDPSAEVKGAAGRLALSRCRWLSGQDFLTTLRVALSEGGVGAWQAAVALWRQVGGRNLDGGTEADESLADVLSEHDSIAWRHELTEALGLPSTLDTTDVTLWRELAAGLESDRRIPGGAAAWRTPCSVTPDPVQAVIGYSLLQNGDKQARARTAVEALASRGPLRGVWDVLVDALSREAGVRDALQFLRGVAVVPRDVVDRVASNHSLLGAGASLGERAVGVLVALESPETPVEYVRDLIEHLGRKGGRFSLWCDVRDLLGCLPEAVTRVAAERALHLLRTGAVSNRIEFIRYALVPLARRGNLDSLEHLLRDREVVGAVSGEIADMLPHLPRPYLRRFLDIDAGLLPEYRRARVADELATREGTTDFGLWYSLAVNEDELPEIRGRAITVLANAPGYWPLSVEDVCTQIQNGHAPLRDAVITSLPSVYPLGLPLEVVDSLVERAHVEQITEIAGRLRPTARGQLASDLVRLARTATTRNRLGIIEALQHESFRAVPGELLAEIWECLDATESDIRRSAAQLVTQIGHRWLSCCAPRVPEGGAFDPLGAGEALPEWLLPHIRKALRPEAHESSFLAAIRVIRELGRAADNQEVIQMLTSALDCPKRRRAATARLSALGWLIDGDEQQTPSRATRLAQIAGMLI